MGSCYRRGDIDAPHSGEHAIEHDILCRNLEQISCFGFKLVDGVNALPLVRDAGGGRSANVEADLFLLAKSGENYRLFLCEVKDKSNDAWYAAVECLRQLRLLISSPESLRIFAQRLPAFSLPANVPVTALVLAPIHFYSARGKKASAVKPALDLFKRFNAEFPLDLRFAVWDSVTCQIQEFQPSIG
jgi:hypothetical protein